MSGAGMDLDDALGLILDDPRRVRSREPALSARLAHVARAGRAPEVVVKIPPGSGKVDPRDEQAHVYYLLASKGRDLQAETQDSERLDYGQACDEVAAWPTMPARKGHAPSKATLHVVLSMPRHTDADSLLAAAKAFAAEAWAGHSYLLVLHQDAKGEHPHVHALVHRLAPDMSALRHGRPELAHWRERFAHHLLGRGVEAAATPRRARGQVRRPEPQPIRHMGERSTVQRSRAEAAAREAVGAALPAARPWLESVRQASERVRQAWRTVAAHLGQTDNPAGRSIVAHAEKIAQQWPEPKTAHELRVERARERLRQRSRSQGQAPER